MPAGRSEVSSVLESSTRSSVYTGILPCQKISEMVAGGEIAPLGILSDILPDQVQPASIDLRLGDYAYPIDASFLPGEGAYVLV
jgi:dCTP deaminase